MNVALVVWLIARLKEPSTYGGLMGLLATYNVPHADQLGPQIVVICMALASIAAIFLPEGKK